MMEMVRQVTRPISNIYISENSTFNILPVPFWCVCMSFHYINIFTHKYTLRIGFSRNTRAAPTESLHEKCFCRNFYNVLFILSLSVFRIYSIIRLVVCSFVHLPPSYALVRSFAFSVHLCWLPFSMFSPIKKY